MKVRNNKVLRIIGTKTLAGALALGLSFGTPVSALAEEGLTQEVTEEALEEVPEENPEEITEETPTEITEETSEETPEENAKEATDETTEDDGEEDTEEVRPQAKKLDGSGEVVDVSDEVWNLIKEGSVSLNAETLFLEDVSTGQKVDPTTGERVDVVPDQKDDSSDKKDQNTDQNTDQEKDDKDNKENPDSGKADQNAEESKKEDTESAKESQEAQTEDPVDTNEALIANQQIVKAPEVIEDFRFWTVARKYAFAKSEIAIRESIPENITGTDTTSAELSKEAAKKEADRLKASYKKTSKKKNKTKIKTKTKTKTDSQTTDLLTKAVEENAALDVATQESTEKVRAVGKLSKDGLLYILQEEDDGWLYVESGDVRGFVKASEVYNSDAAQEILSVYQDQGKKQAKKEKKEYTGIENVAKTAQALVSKEDNGAYTYLRATVGQTLVSKNYALVNDTQVKEAQEEAKKNGTEVVNVKAVNVLEDKNTAANVIGTMNQGNLCYILDDSDKDWLYVESGDVRGFVERKYLTSGEEVKKQVESAGEDSYTLARELVEPEDNGALYYTLTSTQMGTPAGEVRQSIIEYASQFVGNPYVWGGTSLTDGADCSGFVQQIYKAYGYDLPRVAAAQSQYGTQIALEDAQPGDLIFYAENGYVYHVAMYAGNGTTIEAANETQGIIYGTVNTKDAVWATRIIDDNYCLAGAGIGEVNATEDMYGDSLGVFDITYYCSCEICCDVETGITATGAPVVEGETIAVDPSVIPYGTQVIIGGHVFTAEDCGGAIKQNHIDIYVNSHEEALALGRSSAEVYLVK